MILKLAIVEVFRFLKNLGFDNMVMIVASIVYSRSCFCHLTAKAGSVILRADAMCDGFKLCYSLTRPGTIHGVAVSPDGRCVGVGFTSGLVSTLDLRTGLLLASWKAHEADILDVCILDQRCLC